MIDTHTHLYSSSFGEHYGDAVLHASVMGVSRMILPGIDKASISSIRECHEKFPDLTAMAMGLHPTDIPENWQEVLEEMEKELLTGDYVAVGEVGMDLYWTKDNKQLQETVFAHQLEFADKNGLPVIIHSREAFDETLKVIKEMKPSVPLIFHSFTGMPEDVGKIRETCDPYFGINGVVTYKNAAGLREALPLIGTERLLLETDSPYLTPVPYRGKRNESSYLYLIRDKIAEVLDLSSEEIEAITDDNARMIFCL